MLTYLDKEGLGYVSIQGDIEVMNDAESSTLWKDDFLIFYPEGPCTEETPESRFVVVKLLPKRIEFSHVQFAIETAHDSWYPASLNISNDGRWVLDTNFSIL